MWFGDGREERLDATLLSFRLAANPEVTRRREAYHRMVALARAEAESIGKDAVIERLISRLPAYKRELLESRDERLGSGALAEIYARTFWTNFKETKS
jgi:hypothetical protein